jgi:molybdopterin synthase sulfur carrier subunit
MTIVLHLKYFASLREKLDCAEETLSLPKDIQSAEQVRQYLMQRNAVWAEALGNKKALRMAYNKKMLTTDIALENGGELAFFPPVTGG